MKQYKTVQESLDDLDATQRPQVEALRSIIQNAHPGLTEHIKWNSPSYVLNGEDRITFNLHGPQVALLFHMGATKKEDKTGEPVLHDDSGLLTWKSNIRALASFSDFKDIAAKTPVLESIIKQWLALA